MGYEFLLKDLIFCHYCDSMYKKLRDRISLMVICGLSLGRSLYMKKVLAVIAAMSLVFSMAACGKNSNSGKTVTQGGAAVDENGNEIKGSTIDGAGQEVDMDKIDGKSLTSEKVEGIKTKGEVAGFDISIDDAKIVENEDANILVISFSFKNTSSEPIAFDNLFTTDVTQNGSKLMPTVVNADGINVLSGVELIDPGKKTKVQKTYVITDEENPVDVMVYKYAEPTGDVLKKVFNVK